MQSEKRRRRKDAAKMSLWDMNLPVSPPRKKEYNKQVRKDATTKINKFSCPSLGTKSSFVFSHSL